MSTTVGATSRVSGTEGVTGAVITVSMFGVTQSATTTAAGIAVFPNMVQGLVSGNVTVADHTDATWVTELDVEDEFLFLVNDGAVQTVVVSDGTGNETIISGPTDDEDFPANDESLDDSDFLVLPNGEVVVDPGQPLSLTSTIPVFSTLPANMGTIRGYVWAQTDLTNKSAEFAPAGTGVQAYIDVEKLDNQSWWEEDFEYDESDHDYSAYLQYIAYEDALYSTTVDTAGMYVLMVPAAIQGLPIALKCPNFRADQTQWSGSVTITVNRVFGFEIEPADIDNTELNYTISTASGFDALTDTAYRDMQGQIKLANLLQVGSGYACDTVPFAFSGGGAGYGLTDLTTGKIASIALTDSGMGLTADPANVMLTEFTLPAMANVSDFIVPNNNGVVSVVVSTSGSGYDSAAPFVNFPANDFPGSTALGTSMLNAQNGVEMVNVTAAGGGYSFRPDPVISCGTAAGYGLTVDVLVPSTPASATVYLSEDTVIGGVAPGMTTPIRLVVDSIEIFRAVPASNDQGDGYVATPAIDFTQLTTSITVGAFSVDFAGGDPGDVVTTATATIGTGGFLGVVTQIDTITLTVGGEYYNSGAGYDIDGSGDVSGPAYSFTICDGCGAGVAQGPAIVSGQVLDVTIDGGGDYFCGAPIMEFDDQSVTGSGLVLASGFTMGAGGSVGSDTIFDITVVSGGIGYALADFPANGGTTGGTAGEVTILPDLSNLGSGATGLSIFQGVQMVGVNVSDKGGGYIRDPSITIEAPSMDMAGTETAATGTAKMFNGQLIGVTITDPGFGYDAGDFPLTVTVGGGSGAWVEGFFSGFGILAIDITTPIASNNTQGYCSTSALSISNSNGKGSGAAGDLILMDGMVIGIDVTAPGSGYTASPSLDIGGDENNESTSDGVFDNFGAILYANVSGGAITAVDVHQKGGSHFDATCPPSLSIGLSGGSSFENNALKSASFTVAIDALGEIDSVTVTGGGENYPNQNYPTDEQSAWVGGEIVEFDKAVITMPNMDRHVDFYLGTGADTSDPDITSGE